LRVSLVVAPFGLVEYPSLAAGLLKSLAEERAGVECRVRYASLDFARRIGWNAYTLCYYSDPNLLLGERVFAPTLFGDAIPSWTDYWNDVMVPFERPNWQFLRRPEHHGINRRAFEVLQDDAAAWIEEYAARGEFEEVDVFAFTTSFSQNIASLALARRFKERFPDRPIFFGGANCQSVMGEQLIRSFDFIDHVCTGEGDDAWPLALSQLARGEAVDAPGILSRDTEGSIRGKANAVMANDLDRLPAPRFDEYFEDFEFRGAERAGVYAIPMETSRGCWWGEKHHCVFCGLNGTTMRYRSKSPARVVEEIRELSERYSVPRIMMTDNIMDNRSAGELLERLEREEIDVEIFFEIKANLSRDELARLAKAGVTYLQPGIESLSTHVLGLMDKGTDAHQNLQLLKWGKELAISLSWNILCGFPGERDEDYEELARLIPKIYHLVPPRGFGQISIDRFSPMFNRPEAFGIDSRPAKAYRYVYALAPEEIRNLAYTFSFASERTNTSDSAAAPAYARRAYRAFLMWKRYFGRMDFSYEPAADGSIRVHDTRPSAAEEWTEIEGVEARVFVSLDQARTADGVVRDLAESGFAVAPDEVARVIAGFEARTWLHSEGGKSLVLANRVPAIEPVFGFRGLPSAAAGM
jgi:ribosomal peptide maturation radical SAM protein 1